MQNGALDADGGPYLYLRKVRLSGDSASQAGHQGQVEVKMGQYLEMKVKTCHESLAHHCSHWLYLVIGTDHPHCCDREMETGSCALLMASKR